MKSKKWLKEMKYHKHLDRDMRRWERLCGFNRSKSRERNIYKAQRKIRKIFAKKYKA